MKRGQMVTIYHDPETQQNIEGQAELLQKEFDMGNNCEFWQVRFTDGDEVGRIINVSSPAIAS